MKVIGKTLLLILLPLLGADMAQAVSLSKDGTGDVLIYPLYSVESGNDTYVSLVNQSDQAKAVRVRFRESMENHPVLSFNLYLAPHDHWAGAVTTDAGGGARLISADASCTFPDIPPKGLVFSDAAYAGINAELQGLARTGEGLVEVIEMGVVNDSVQDCAAIHSAWSEGSAWAQNPANDVLPTTGGLSGYGVIVNVNEGTNITYSATALKDFFENKSMHRHPEIAAPTLADADPVAYFDGLITMNSGIEAVNLILMKAYIRNEYVMANSIAASTDLVVTFPTKNLYQIGSDFDSEGFSPDNFYVSVIDTFLENYPNKNIHSEGYYLEIESSPCWVICFYDRYQQVSVSLSGAANIIPLAEETVLYPSSRSRKEVMIAQYKLHWTSTNPDPNFLESYSLAYHSAHENLSSGFVGVTLSVLPDDIVYYRDGEQSIVNSGDEAIAAYGKPAIGFAVQKYVNGNVNGLLSNYTVVTDSIYESRIEPITH